MRKGGESECPEWERVPSLFRAPVVGGVMGLRGLEKHSRPPASSEARCAGGEDRVL